MLQIAPDVVSFNAAISACEKALPKRFCVKAFSTCEQGEHGPDDI